MRNILAQVKQYKRSTLLTPFYAMLEVFMEVLLPFIMAKMIDDGIKNGDMNKVWLYGGIMLAAAAVSLFSGVMAGVHASKASTGLACNLREEIYRRIQTFSFSNIDKFSTAGLVTRMTTDVTNIQNAFQMSIRIAVRAPMMLISSMIMSFSISHSMSMLFLVALVILAGFLSLIVANAMKAFSAAFHKYDELNASVQENVSAIRVVKAYVREDYEKKKFSNASNNLYNMFVKAEKIVALNNPVMMLVSYSSIIAISWVGAHLVVKGELETGQLTALFTYIFNAFISLMMLSFIFVMISMSTASVKRIGEVLKEVPDLANGDDPVREMKDGAIDFDDVSFAYFKGENKEVLRNIDLHIKAGETVGIIGSTGSGKTSLVNLISRLYDVTEGSVKVGGVDVRDYDMEYLRNNVSVVLQKNVLFSGSILENLRWGNENATEEECMEACKAACADEFIQNMTDKYHTRIERGGNNVSGGQKQRLCIARALLKKPKVLILDDSTSAVDTATDAKIKEAFAKKIPGTTKLIIAQRISSVEMADRIIVLEDGRINGIGTHEQLLENNEIYKDIYSSQVGGGGDFDRPEDSSGHAVDTGKEGE